jgi:hypothetical protein
MAADAGGDLSGLLGTPNFHPLSDQMFRETVMIRFQSSPKMQRTLRAKKLLRLQFAVKLLISQVTLKAVGNSLS